MSGICSWSAKESATYSASVVDKAVNVCSFDDHVIGQSAYLITQPERDFAFFGSDKVVGWFQSHAKLASTQQ